MKLKYYSQWHRNEHVLFHLNKWTAIFINCHIQSRPQILTQPHKQNRQRCSGATLSRTLLFWNHLVSLKYWYGNQHWVIWQSDGETLISLSDCLFTRTRYSTVYSQSMFQMSEKIKQNFYRNCIMLDRSQLYSLQSTLTFRFIFSENNNNNNKHLARTLENPMTVSSSKVLYQPSKLLTWFSLWDYW